VHQTLAAALASIDTLAHWNGYWNLYKQNNLTLPGGSCYSVGAGGHICGRGYDVLSRKYGLTVDWLTGVEIVTIGDFSPIDPMKTKAREVLMPRQSLFA
jgi:FAD/FMN-containing dehydrogenase